MGADVRVDGTAATVLGGSLVSPDRPVDVGNSGTTIRLLAGLCAGQGVEVELAGDESLNARPMERVAEPLRRMGAKVTTEPGGTAPLTLGGGALTGVDYSVPVPSAQVKGAVLLAALGADGPTTVREAVTTRLHTEEMLADAGVMVERGPGITTVHPGRPSAVDRDVPGDPSQAAFWVVAATIVPDSDLTLERVYLGPERTGFLTVLQRMGADIEIADDDLRVRAAPLTGTTVDGAEITGLDEVPALAVAAATADGVTRFVDVGELRHKESDRLATTAALLHALGGRTTADGDALAVIGGALGSGIVEAAGDHRIAMAGAVAGLAASGPVTVEGWDAVTVSYPGFEGDLAELTSGRPA